jgi:predicted nuclease with RNAse H fold
MADKPVFIGVDPTSGSRPMTYAVLNENLDIETVGDGTFDEVVEIITSFPVVICAIDAPNSYNKGLLADPDYRQRVGLSPGRHNYEDFRVSEYELRRRGIGIYNTPRDQEQARGWIQEGWRLYEKLREANFVDYPRPGSRRLLETHPHAAFTVLVGSRPYRKTSLEGRVQRQLVLHEEGIGVPDAMKVFIEWTRHRFLTGQLETDRIYEHDQLDAIVAAYVAYLAEREPGNITTLGDPTEGQIVIPVEQLQDSY